jgi:hypothetical protein
MGLLGGGVVKEERGSGFFSEIGRKGGRSRAARAAARHATEQGNAQPEQIRPDPTRYD